MTNTDLVLWFVPLAVLLAAPFACGGPKTCTHTHEERMWVPETTWVVPNALGEPMRMLEPGHYKTVAVCDEWR